MAITGNRILVRSRCFGLDFDIGDFLVWGSLIVKKHQAGTAGTVEDCRTAHRQHAMRAMQKYIEACSNPGILLQVLRLSRREILTAFAALQKGRRGYQN